jgi:N-methylhydantoinase B
MTPLHEDPKGYVAKKNIVRESQRMEDQEKRLEPFLMSILAGRFRAITKEMSNTLMRSSRSTVMNTAKDFSCAITDEQCRIVFIAEGLPIQLAAINLIPQAVKDLFGEDIHPGDVFLNNSPFHGNLHHADATVTAPVFYKGQLRFFVTDRAHQADTGAPQPTVFLPFAASVQEEGLHVPCVRVQRNYEDIRDVVRMIKYRIRVPEQWYGDYIAQVGSLRVAEKRLLEMCDKYGADTLSLFVSQWQEYGKNRMIAEIAKLPKGVWEGTVTHDPIPGIVPEGIRLMAKIAIYPEEGYIDVDIRDNPDNIPCGFNLSEAATIGSVLSGILYNLDPTIPHNDGAFGRIKIEMREGCIVGKPTFPVGTSVCTTNLCDRLISLVQSVLAQLGPGYGMAEGRSSLTAASSVVSGVDWRRDGAPFINFLAFPPCGPALSGHDGWLTYAVSAAGGAVFTDSIELDEQKYPLIFDKNELATDSGGSGQWDGAPATDVRYGARKDPTTIAWVIDEKVFPAKGVRGGLAGRPCDVYKVNVRTGDRENLPTMATMTLGPDERLVSEGPGGAGYGDPLDRDPELVRLRVREEWLSLERARDVYGVVVNTSSERYAVDYGETGKLRERLRQQKVQR